MAHNIYFDIPINATSDKIFTAVSDARELEKWWPLKCVGEPKIGEIYNFNFTDKYDWYARVTEMVPNEKIVFQMTKSDADWDPTTFGFEVEQQGQKSILQFFHKEWQENSHHFRHSAYCWAMLLNGLKNLVEHNIIIPFENRS